MDEKRMNFQEAHTALFNEGDEKKRAALQRFFKTGKGEYGEGDRFIGVMVPKIRELSRQFSRLPLSETEKLLRSEYNEERLLAVFILRLQFEKGPESVKKEVCYIYLRNLRHINNWNLVDGSAPYIIGPFLENSRRDILYEFARSGNLWRRRIAIMSTSHFIRLGEFVDALKIIGLLLKDKHDLIHKACGWMLREIGKRDVKVLESFLSKKYRKMPRTMLRYAIERFSKKKRHSYLTGNIPGRRSR